MQSVPTGNTSDTARLMVDAPGFAVGWQERVFVPAPAAGAQWSYKVDGRYHERLVAATMVFATSIVVANRFPVLLLTDNNGKVIAEVPTGNSVAASATLTTFLNLHGPAYANGGVGNTYGFLPEIMTPGDWVWGSGVANMDVADQWSGVVLLVHRFPNDAARVSVNG